MNILLAVSCSWLASAIRQIVTLCEVALKLCPESVDYLCVRKRLKRDFGEGIKQLAEVARIEDRNHIEALTPRIYELGGKLPDGMKVFRDMSACLPGLPKDLTNIKAMLTVLVNAERCAVGGYSHICNITAGKDHRTYDLSLAILNEEVEHESWFSEFLEKVHPDTSCDKAKRHHSYRSS